MAAPGQIRGLIAGATSIEHGLFLSEAQAARIRADRGGLKLAHAARHRAQLIREDTRLPLGVAGLLLEGGPRHARATGDERSTDDV